MIWAFVSGFFAVCSGIFCLYAKKAKRDTRELLGTLRNESGRIDRAAPPRG